MTDIAALIARLESATDGSRELDEAIATYLWGGPRPSGNVGEARTLVWWHNGLGRSIAPEFTESLDAALTLLPAGWSWKLVWEPGCGLYCAVLTHADRLGIVAPTIVCSKTTAPLAVCIVALKARSEIPRGTGDGE